MKENGILVFAGWEDDEIIGIIRRNVIGGEEVTSFEYDNTWIQKHPQLLLDPTILLMPYRNFPKDKKLFGAFQDSCPDRWGRRLIDRRESLRAAEEGCHPKHFFDTDYMLAVQDELRNGGFRYKISENDEFVSHDPLPVPPISSIRDLEQISLGYENGDDERWISQLIAPGSSLGGARPKANVMDTDGSLWIAKFPSRNDDFDVGAWEMVVHDLAAECGIAVPEAKLSRYSDLGSTFLSKRFDRAYTLEGKKRIHFSSALTMLGLRDGATDGYGYLDLAETVQRITKEPKKELEQLFRRVVFDIGVSNYDNHFRNHGFLLEENEWHLSPAYDINPVNNVSHLSINIDEDDGFRSFEKALETSEYYQLSKEEARSFVKQIAQTIAGRWREIAANYGIKEQEKKYMAPAFALAAEY